VGDEEVADVGGRRAGPCGALELLDEAGRSRSLVGDRQGVGGDEERSLASGSTDFLVVGPGSLAAASRSAAEAVAHMLAAAVSAARWRLATSP